MQTNSISSAFSSSARLTLDKVKTIRQEDDFANILKQASGVKDDAGNSSDEDAKLRNVCQELESVFLNMMLTQMRATIPKSNLMGDNNNAREIWQSMMDTETSKDMAKAGGIGLADVIYQQLSPAKSNITTSPTNRPIISTQEK